LSTLVVFAATPDPFWQLSPRFEADVVEASPWPVVFARDTQAFIAALPEATVIVAYPFAPGSLRRASALRAVHLLSAGIPEGFMKLARERDIEVTTSSGENATVVAEQALLLTMYAIRGVGALRRWEPHRWQPTKALADLRVVVLGAGPVGVAIGVLFARLVARVTLMSRTARDGMPSYMEALSPTRDADVVVLACPSTAETRALFGSLDALMALREDVALVNVARGELVDERHVASWLEARPRARYATDVTTPEPYPNDGLLRRTPRVWITPHVGGRGPDVRGRLEARALERVRALAASLGARP